jgi:hypothetical protein
MAIYRKGKASMDKSGIITGVDTKWKKSLALLRAGATMIFATNPAVYVTVSNIVSDTELRAIDTGGQVVSEPSEYVILLHDSLTVDGLAQDVAETLRYYQGKENQFAHFIEVVKTLDIDSVQATVDKIKEENEKFQDNLKRLEDLVAEAEEHASSAGASAEEATDQANHAAEYRNQSQEFSVQAENSARSAAEQVVLAKLEVRNAQDQVNLARQEVENAKAVVAEGKQELRQEVSDIVTNAKNEVKQEASDIVNSAKEEVKQEATEIVNNAKQEVISAGQAQVQAATEQANKSKGYSEESKKAMDTATAQVALATEQAEIATQAANESEQQANASKGYKDEAHQEAERAKGYADEIRDIGLSMDVTNLLRKDKNLSDLTNPAEARKNISLDRVHQDPNMTRISSNDPKTELRIGQDQWYVYRTAEDSTAGYIPLPIHGGGTGATDVEEAKQNLDIDRLHQENNGTYIRTASEAHSLFVGDDGHWGVIEHADEVTYKPLEVVAGGTGASTAEEARENLKLDRFQQDDNMTRIKSEDPKTELRLGSLEWGVYRTSSDSEQGYIALPIRAGGTGATDLAGARRNLEFDRLTQEATITRLYNAAKTYDLFIDNNGNWGAKKVSDSSNVALGVSYGGTGATTLQGAKEKFGVDRFIQEVRRTEFKTANGLYRLYVGDEGDWGVLDGSSSHVALKVAAGGTGARDAAGARENLGIGDRATVKHGTVQLESSAVNPLLLKSTNPCIKFEETDPREGSASSYYLVMDGGNIRMQEDNTGSGDTVFEYIANTNTMKLPKAEFRDRAGTRNNLELGTANTVTFSQVRAPNGMICTTESNSANDNPSAPLVMQIRASDKSTILGQAEFRADRNGALSIINRTEQNSPKFMTIQKTGEMNPPGPIVSNNYGSFSHMEIGQKNANTSAYIDFHYGAKYDYDARILCDGMNSDQVGGGNLRFYAGYINMNAKSSYSFTGGRFTIDTTDVNINTQTWFKFNGSAILLQNKTANYASNILSKDFSGDNLWYVGRGSNNDNTVTLHNYRFNTTMHLRQSDVYVNRDFTAQGNVVINGSSLYVDGGSGSSSTHLWLRNSSKKVRAVIYSNDSQQVLYFRADNPSTGAGGKTMSWNGATGALTVTSLSQTSDERAKFWIKPVTGALDKICELNGVTFSMHTTIQNTVRNAGVIAQDVRKVLPEAVTEHKTDKSAPVIDKNCQPVENPLSVDYNALSALYVEAFKEVKELIDAQKTEIDALKAEIAELKAKA